MSEQIEITLETMANGGSALGRSAGRTVFIPYTIPGETVLAQVVAEKGRTLFAEGQTLLTASADRIFPRCEFSPAQVRRLPVATDRLWRTTAAQTGCAG